MWRMGFSECWVKRILNFISSVSFNFKLNSSIFGDLKPLRGLRQGDPISLYLFLICVEAFSSLLSRAADIKEIHGVRVCRGAPVISHLFFADDSIIFAKTSMQKCSKFVNIIGIFERASGQRVNYAKTQISFSKNVLSDVKLEITRRLGVVEVDRHEKYLGLPTIVRKSKKVVFTSIKERIWKKLQGGKKSSYLGPVRRFSLKLLFKPSPLI